MAAPSNGTFDGNTIHFVREVPGPVERVWEHLTSSALIPVWFGSEGMEFSIGHGKDEPVSLMGGHITGRVVDWQPTTTLAYTWNLNQPGMPPTPESTARFTLQPLAEGIELRLEQTPVPAPVAPFSLSGWHSFLDRLGAMLRGEELGDVMQAMQDNQTTYERLLAQGQQGHGAHGQ